MNQLGLSLKTIAIMAFSFIVIYIYYVVFSFHGESTQHKFIYLGIVAFLYACYKIFYLALDYQEIRITPTKVMVYFLGHLLLLCVLFFMFSGIPGVSGVILFSKIVSFLGLLIILNVVLIALGKQILQFLSFDIQRDRCFTYLAGLAIGYVVFFLYLSVIGALGLYSIGTVLGFLVGAAFVGYKQIVRIWKDFTETSVVFKNHDISSKDTVEQFRPYLLSSEFLFVVLTGLLAVNFINVMRPFPIGWDDLGVYMNYAKLLANSGGNIAPGQMYPWQLFTGIGFLFQSQTFAFFLNSFTGIGAAGVMFYGFRSLVPQKSNTYFNISLLTTTIFLALPMVIFQIAKDMKLDVGLYTISLLSLYILFYLYSRYEEFSDKQRYSLLFLVGALAGLAFTIKVTSLLLISGIFAVVFFHYLGILGFLGYICLYIGVFTFFGLWDFMNVIYPQGDVFKQIVSGISFISGAFLLGGGTTFSKDKTALNKTIISITVILIGILALFLPWGTKNIIETQRLGYDINLMRVISGKSEDFVIDYSLLYTPSELTARKQVLDDLKDKKDGSVVNEDFGRYFGYEPGINNYLKLPWNLTMQTNQKGEFTDISYIFFALIPAIFLFLPARRKWFPIGIAAILVFELLYFIPSPVSSALTGVFGYISNPLGYAVILLPYILGFTYMYFGAERKTPRQQVFFLALSFTAFFMFLWSISALGVVWYGIAMYGTFLLLIYICYLYISEYDNKNPLPLAAAFLVFLIPVVYLFQSSIPHYITNLKKASYTSYKMGQISESSSIFKSHPEYIEILFSLNIQDDKKQGVISKYKQLLTSEISGKIPDTHEIFSTIRDAQKISTLIAVTGSFSRASDQSKEFKVIKASVKDIEEQIYKEILLPEKQDIADSHIYRVGTFLKYFIVDNNKRLLEDSLLTVFDAYYFDDNYDVTYQRMKKVGLSYILVDLNAATIDNDPRKDLTRRYENMLKSFTASNLSLIKTDSICLEAGLYDYSKNKDIETYLLLAGVNHTTGNTTKSDKLQGCHKYISDVFAQHEVTLDSYPYLLSFKNFMIQRKGDINNPTHVTQALRAYAHQGYKVLFQIH